jgi:hypothetical protein
MHRRIAIVLTALALVALAAAPSRLDAAAEQTTVPIAFDLDDPCTGETVHLSGELFVLTGVAQDARGVLHEHHLAAWRHVEGVGQTSGASYRAVGIESHDSASFDPTGGSVRFVFTSTATLTLVGPAAQPNMQTHGTIHVTVLADGTVTADVDNFRFQRCTG